MNETNLEQAPATPRKRASPLYGFLTTFPAVFPTGFLALFSALSFAALAVSATQKDTFEAGTAGWSHGPTSPNPPTVMSGGGPAGAGDAFLKNVASGEDAQGGHMVVFNRDQWTGDYTTLGTPLAVAADVANFGAAPLSLRLGLQGTTSKTRYASTQAVTVLADGEWHAVAFPVAQDAMTNVGGKESFSAVLADVSELRIVSAEAKPAWSGDGVAGTLGIDNVRVIGTSP